VAAITFAQAGADVMIADVDSARMADTARLVREKSGREPLSQRADVSIKSEVDALAARAIDEFGRVDIWANVAGVLRYSKIVDTTEAELMTVVSVNLFGVYWGTAAAGRVMTSAGRGSIINIASAGGDVPAPTLSVYGMTKAAVMHVTKTAAAEFGVDGVRANAIAPGFIDTPMVAHYWTTAEGQVDPAARERTLQQRAAGAALRITGLPTDISYCMLYLASDASRFMTGQVLRPNGGVVMP
jgi:3-oxoacyl-[acyl-carrier protein] reductase